MCRDHFSKSGPGGKNKICLSKIRSLWEKLRLFKVRLNPLASNSRATLARFVRTLQAHISAPSDPILLPHILFFASGSDLKESSLPFFTEKFSSTRKVTSTETDILSNFLERVSQAHLWVPQLIWFSHRTQSEFPRALKHHLSTPWQSYKMATLFPRICGVEILRPTISWRICRVESSTLKWEMLRFFPF